MYGKSIKDMKKFIVSFCGLLCCVWPARLSARGMAFVLQAGRLPVWNCPRPRSPWCIRRCRFCSATYGRSWAIPCGFCRQGETSWPVRSARVVLSRKRGLTSMPWRGGNRPSFCRYSPTGVLASADATATARIRLMEVSRLLGVSPWEWWADATPETRTHFELPAGYRDLQFPSVEYRGIFINDEDWGLMPWSSTCYELGIRKGASGRARTSAFLSCSCACGPTSIGLPCTNAPSHSPDGREP